MTARVTCFDCRYTTITHVDYRNVSHTHLTSLSHTSLLKLKETTFYKIKLLLPLNIQAILVTTFTYYKQLWPADNKRFNRNKKRKRKIRNSKKLQ